MSDIIQENKNSSLDTFRKVLAMTLFIVATPIMMFGYMGLLPKNLGLKIFIAFIAMGIGYFAIDKIIEEYLKKCGFEFPNDINQNKLLK